jgi:NADPH:quinone reductase-like Zn-dependent oxidoreductase
MLLDVMAAGLHPRVRSQATGSHYTSTGELPLVPGIDGVGRGPDGRLRYFVLPDTQLGSMAEQTVIDSRRSIELPEGTDAIAVAAAMNPAMSSWVALKQRADFAPGQGILVLGATGSAGRLAVQTAKLLGAGQIIAVARNAQALTALPALGATETVVLDGSAESFERLGDSCAGIDITLDYLWGAPAADALSAIVPRRHDDSQPLTWIQIGSVAGPTSPIPSAALRATRLQIVGSGQGSVSPGGILAVLPDLAELISAGTFQIDAEAVPLEAVGKAWNVVTDKRLVVTPA